MLPHHADTDTVVTLRGGLCDGYGHRDVGGLVELRLVRLGHDSHDILVVLVADPQRHGRAFHVVAQCHGCIGNAFLALLPQGHCAAFEFRNETWFDDEVYAALKGANAALVLSEREDNAPPPLVETTSWGYVRLRLETYTDADLAQWAKKLAATNWNETFVYFMHEPTAPAYAKTLMELAK